MDLPPKETQEFVCALVINKTVYARIDRLTKIVEFGIKPTADKVMNLWKRDIDSLLDRFVKTSHLIAKEEMVHAVVARAAE